MTRTIAAVLALALVLALPAAAGAQSGISEPIKLAYQEPNGEPAWQFNANWWFANGTWKFTGPTDAKGGANLITLGLRYHWRGPWTFGLGYGWGSWKTLSFNGNPAPATVSGSEELVNFDVRYRTNARIQTDVIVGWQVFRTRTAESQFNSKDEARSGGIRIGLESTYPINERWSVRGLFTWAPSLGVTEEYRDPTTSTTTTYHGTMSDLQLAVAYTMTEAWKAELGYRYSFIRFNRPADVVDHTLDGIFLNLVYTR